MSDGQASVALPPFSIAVTSIIVNSAPTITGTPISSVEAGSAYSFVPTGNDADGDALTFSISGQPVWAGFDPVNGALTGIPAIADVGNYPNIVISVSDSQASASLAAISIEVLSVAANNPPTISGVPSTEVTVDSGLDRAGARRLLPEDLVRELELGPGLVRELVGERLVEEVISDLLDEPRVSFIHARNCQYGCYLFRIDRAPGKGTDELRVRAQTD